MSELDERRIAELAKQPAQVLASEGSSSAARDEARRVLECQAAMRAPGGRVDGSTGGRG